MSHRPLVHIFLLLAILCLPAGESNGIVLSPRYQQSDLNSIIDALQKKYYRMNGLAADFIQIYHGTDGRTIKESGRLYIKKPGKARWEYSSPEKKIFVSDGKSIFFHVYGEPFATRASIRDSGDPQIPFLFLLGRGDLRRDFTRIELLNDEVAIETGNKIVRLVPRNAPSAFHRLLVEVNLTSSQVKRLVIIERNGARMDFFLTNVQDNYVAPEPLFQFTPPPGVRIKQSQG